MSEVTIVAPGDETEDGLIKFRRRGDGGINVDVTAAYVELDRLRSKLADTEYILENHRKAADAACAMAGGGMGTPDGLERAVADLVAERDAARAEAEALRGDLADAAGDLALPLPAPGSPMAKVMSANRIMKSERDAARSEVERLTSGLAEATASFDDMRRDIRGLRSERDAARRERNEARAERDRWMSKAKDAHDAARLACGLAEVEHVATSVVGSLDNIINRLRAALSDVSKLEAERDEVAAAVEHLVAFADDPSHPAYKAAEECKSLTAGRIEASIEAMRMERDANARLTDVLEQRNDQACAAAAEVGIDADHITQALDGLVSRVVQADARCDRLIGIVERLTASGATKVVDAGDVGRWVREAIIAAEGRGVHFEADFGAAREATEADASVRTEASA